MTGVRLEAARYLLGEGKGTVESVAEATGFADASHLTRCFVRRFGVTPGSYRRR